MDDWVTGCITKGGLETLLVSGPFGDSGSPLYQPLNAQVVYFSGALSQLVGWPYCRRWVTADLLALGEDCCELRCALDVVEWTEDETHRLSGVPRAFRPRLPADLGH